MIAGWGPQPFRAQGKDIGLNATEEGKGQLGAFKGSSMEERGLTCAAGVGRGQIGVRVCVSGTGGGNDNMLSGNGREGQMASARNHTLSGASVENEYRGQA